MVDIAIPKKIPDPILKTASVFRGGMRKFQMIIPTVD
jgi:hypothetical protein